MYIKVTSRCEVSLRTKLRCQLLLHGLGAFLEEVYNGLKWVTSYVAEKYEMKLGLTGFHALVTGGTRGLGKAIVIGLLREGVNISYCARTVTNEEFGEFEIPASEDSTSSATRPRAVGTKVDVSDQQAIKLWVQAAAEEFGRIDIVVSNASPLKTGPSLDHWTESFQADILGTVVLVESVIPHLELSPSPSILIQGSAAGREPFILPGGRESPYGPFKAALTHYAATMSRILGPRNIRVNTLAPGLIKWNGSGWERYCNERPDDASHLISQVATRRWGTPEEVANCAVFLVSPAASYVSGETMLVTGGLHQGTQF